MLNESKYNQIDALYKYVCLYKHRINRIELETVLKSSPSYPSLLSIYRSLEFCKISTNVVRAKCENLYTLNRPCLIHIEDCNSEYFLLIKYCNEKHITYYDTHKSKYIKLESEVVLSKWDGILIYTEHEERRTIKGLFTIIAVLFTFLSCLHWNSLLISINLWGLFFSVSLLLHENGIRTSIVEGVCKIGETFDCNKVTQSRASKIFGIPLSVLGNLYFFSIVLFLLIAFVSGNTLMEIINHLQMINIGCLPIVGYSVIKQYQLKTWCLLCLSIIGLLLFEIIILSVQDCSFFISSRLVVLHLLCIVISGLFVLLLQQELILYRQHVSLHIKDLRIKRNPATLYMLFKNAKVLDQADSSYISLGNTEASIVITTWISPFCKHCSEVVRDMLKLYYQHKTKVEWRIYIPEHVSYKWGEKPIQRTFIQWYKKDKQKFLESLKCWFIDKKLLSINTTDKLIYDDVGDNSEKQSRFTKKMGIKSYPTCFINGLEIPSDYTIKDIYYMIDDEESWTILRKIANKQDD